MTPDPEQLRAFAERYTAAWCTMDPVAVAAHYAPEGSSRSTESRRGYGRDLELQDRTEIASGEQSAGAGQSSGRPRGGVERRFE